MEQLGVFDLMYSEKKINKPIRLIELFAGYGSQSLALKYLGVEFIHWRICEWAVKSIQAYKDIHFTDIDGDFTKNLNKDDLANELFRLGISMDYNKPMTLEQIKRLKEEDLRKIYNNIKIENNLVNIQQTKGKDLYITDTDKYEYIMTYSFPCQDLSLAGKRKGMSDTSTRSGMLWEVERILGECKELGNLPQILLMENVPQVHSQENIEDFRKWQLALEKLGYQSYWQDLIATDYYIPQTRNRCFMISILGKYNYKFPKGVELKLRLKDLLEKEVDEKYYLSDKMINCFLSESKDSKYPRKERFLQTLENTNEKGIAATLCTTGGTRATDNFIKVKNATKQGYLEATDGDGIDISSRMEHHRGTVQKDKIQTITTAGGNERGVVVNMKTKLCNDLIQQGKVKENDVIRHSYTTSRNNNWDKRNVEQNNISPTLDTRCDCLGVVTIGNYSPSNHNASRVVDKDYVAPTVMENHGTITATQTNDLRIRKLTPRECFRLMGVKDEDIDNVCKNQSDSSLYHLAGDSIVTTCLMAIFEQLLDINWKDKIERGLKKWN